jgi:alpha-amylase/alpha-mannosidase (GH57 family)
VSKLVRDNPEAREFILKAQCNDAYWHGVFGGIYLPHLRRAIWKNLIRANSHVKTGNFVKDIDFDGRDEVFIENGSFYAVFKPSYGGALFELSSKKKAVNYNDVLARRWEHYHEVPESATPEEDVEGGVASIHELGKRIPDEIRRELAYDNHLRAILQDHFLDPETTLDEYRLNRYVELGDFVTGAYNFTLIENGIILEREGSVAKKPARVEKSFRLTEEGFIVDYTVRSDTKALFGVELNLAVHSVMEEPGEFRAEKFEVNDPYGIGKVEIELDREAKIWKYPVKTLSQSEAGWDFIQQGVSYTILFSVEGELRFRLHFKEL